MVQQHDAANLIPVRIFRGSTYLLCQNKPRHDVGQNQHLGAVDFPQDAIAIGAVADGNHRIGMAVVHVLVGNEGVQDSLYRRSGRGGIQQGQAQLTHHLAVAQGR